MGRDAPAVAAKVSGAVPARQQIGPYLIVSRVGAGGMVKCSKRGTEPRARRRNQVTALRIGGRPRSPEQPGRGRRAASALNHPNIVRVYDADVDGTSYYLVSEWLEGKSLRDESSRGACRSETAARSRGADRRWPGGGARRRASCIATSSPRTSCCARDGTARIVDFGLARSSAASCR